MATNFRGSARSLSKVCHKVSNNKIVIALIVVSVLTLFAAIHTVSYATEQYQHEWIIKLIDGEHIVATNDSAHDNDITMNTNSTEVPSAAALVTIVQMSKNKTAQEQKLKLCKVYNALLPNKHLWSMVHHKTGHDLSWSINGIFNHFCNRKNKLKSFHSEFSIRKFLKSCINPDKCIYIHWVRRPLNIIISGFYYHLKTDEFWVRNHTIKTSFNTAINMNMNALYTDIINNRVDERNLYRKYIKEITGKQRRGTLMTCFDMNFIEPFIEPFIDNVINSNASFILNQNVSLQEFYQNVSLQDYKIGLFYEFVRFFNCEWSSIYVLQEIGRQRFSNVINWDIDEMMNGEYNHSMSVLLDAVNIMDNERNRNKLKNENINATITDLRQYLMNALVQLDISRTKQPLDEHTSMHVTRHQYNRKQVTLDLLSMDHNICILIKNMTVLLMFDWRYDVYC